MQPKPCRLCGQPADVAFVVLSSTLRISPRRQKSSSSIAICKPCVNAFINARSSTEVVGVGTTLTEALATCYHALTRQFERDTEPKELGETAHEQVEPSTQPTSTHEHGVSCRPCLTACNSRHFDDPTTVERCGGD